MEFSFLSHNICSISSRIVNKKPSISILYKKSVHFNNEPKLARLIIMYDIVVCRGYKENASISYLNDIIWHNYAGKITLNIVKCTHITSFATM
jgi:hypothetical protein